MRGGVAVALALAVACRSPQTSPAVSRAWPAMGTTMSAAVWGTDTARIERALDALRDSVEPRLVTGFDSLRREIRRQTGVTIDAEGFARGHALDRAGLGLAGIADSALLDLGGQFLWIGRRATSRTVGIADPDNSLRALATVEMRGGSVSTSSPAEGRRGRGGARSVAVLAPSAMAADAWSTALMVLGCDSALALAPRLARWQVNVVCADSSAVRWTTDLDGRVLLPTVPPDREGRGGRPAATAPAP